jgi:four helix bundle protein
MYKNKKYDLEDRLIDYTILISEIVESLPYSRLGHQIGNQLIRSGTSPALNYGEAQSAESKNDFIHKLKITLKELRESYVCLKIIRRKPLINNFERLSLAEDEANQLISILVKSVQTAKNKM